LDLLGAALGKGAARRMLLASVVAPLFESLLASLSAAAGGGEPVPLSLLTTLAELATEAASAASAPHLAPATAAAADAVLARWNALGAAVLDFVPNVREAVTAGASDGLLAALEARGAAGAATPSSLEGGAVAGIEKLAAQ
jgi:hypothetical protein